MLNDMTTLQESISRGYQRTYFSRKIKKNEFSAVQKRSKIWRSRLWESLNGNWTFIMLRTRKRPNRYYVLWCFMERQWGHPEFTLKLKMESFLLVPLKQYQNLFTNIPHIRRQIVTATQSYSNNHAIFPKITNNLAMTVKTILSPLQ